MSEILAGCLFLALQPPRGSFYNLPAPLPAGVQVFQQEPERGGSTRHIQAKCSAARVWSLLMRTTPYPESCTFS